MTKEVYDSIRRIDDKEEKIKKIIEKNTGLNALERYMLMAVWNLDSFLRSSGAVLKSE